MKKIKKYNKECTVYIVFMAITTLIFSVSPKDSSLHEASFGGLVILAVVLPFLIALILVEEED
ncbi:hypothetical protein [Pantoea ananatis]|uniref:hypothetical protein n=1 Tax=Pantoea ananas TaxID=553 RepID=UPI0025C801BB|nr:hypothetical protein [Pantoea ananatis]MDN4129316.1 hypothetical protein [Pantoea ananatis]MDN4151645.1 hypothetical protein [Pantoea ananatis]